MLSIFLPLAGIVAALGVAVALVFMALAVRTAVKAKPEDLKEVRVEFSSKRRIIMQWQDPAPPPPEDARPRLVRDDESA